MDLELVTTAELLVELRKRFDMAVFVAFVNKTDTLESMSMMSKGDRWAVLGLMDFGSAMIREAMMNSAEPPDTLET